VSSPGQQPAALETLVADAGDLLDAGRLSEGIALYDGILGSVSARVPKELEVPIADAFVNKAWAHEQLHQPREALGAYGEVIRRFSGSTDPYLRKHVAYALVGRAECFAEVELYDASLDALNHLATEFGEDRSAAVQEVLDGAARSRARALNGLKRYSEALAEIQNYLDAHRDELAGDTWAVALDRKASALEGLGQFGEALVAHEQILAMPEISEEDELRACAAYGRASDLQHLGRLEEARLAHADAARTYAGSTDQAARNVASLAASALESLNR
jgi:tetratricopeptide (TPR) repeat protein